KFGLKRFPVTGPGEEVGWPVLSYLLWKNYRRRDPNRLVPPRRMDAAVCRAEVCYPSGGKHGRHRAVRRREFITLTRRRGRVGAGAESTAYGRKQSEAFEMDMDISTIDGSCHCGTVRFRVRLTNGLHTARRCTCSYCRMRGAIAVSADLGGVDILSGAEELSLYKFNT